MAETIEMLFGVWIQVGPEEACARWGAHWRHLANAIEPSMFGGDAAFLSNYFDHLLWSPYVIGQTIIFLPCDFFLLLLFLFFPRLISATVDWMSTILPHMVWP